MNTKQFCEFLAANGVDYTVSGRDTEEGYTLIGMRRNVEALLKMEEKLDIWPPDAADQDQFHNWYWRTQD